MNIDSYSFPVSIDTDEEKEFIIGFLEEVDNVIYF